MASGICDEFAYGRHLNLLNLPREVLEKIFSYVSYDETSSARLVSKTFDVLCRARLNDGLNRVDRLHSQIHREVKGKLPRRESERRNHVLARHIDILSAIETRLSLLNMTYSKYIDLGLCCFIPGKVLDEMFHVLREIRRVSNPPRAHELLQELRDISSMAMEHFDEKIVPLLKQESHPSCPRFSYTDAFVTLSSMPKVRTVRLHKTNTVVLQLRRKVTACQKLVLKQKRRVVEVEKKLIEQTNFTTEMERHKVEQDRRIAELEQKVVDYDQKYVDMMVEIGRVRAACGGGDGGIAQAPKDGKPEGKPAVETTLGNGDSQIKSSVKLSESNCIDEIAPKQNIAKRIYRKPTRATNPGNQSERKTTSKVTQPNLYQPESPSASTVIPTNDGYKVQTAVDKETSVLVTAEESCQTYYMRLRKRKLPENSAVVSLREPPKRSRKVKE